MKRLLLISTAIISGCTTIYFDNLSDGQRPGARSMQWHHNLAFDLYEASGPVDLNKACRGGEWLSVKRQTSFLNGLAGGAVNVLAPIWYPDTVTVTCAHSSTSAGTATPASPPASLARPAAGPAATTAPAPPAVAVPLQRTQRYQPAASAPAPASEPGIQAGANYRSRHTLMLRYSANPAKRPRMKVRPGDSFVPVIARDVERTRWWFVRSGRADGWILDSSLRHALDN